MWLGAHRIRVRHYEVVGIALGEPHVTRGMVFVFFDRILETAHVREHDRWRVLSYVIAHESGHLVLASPAHSSTEITRAEWDREVLRRIASRYFSSRQIS
jgi:hypothetical protein